MNYDQADVDGNAMTIAFPEDEEKNPDDSTLVIKRMGMNRLYASRLRIDVDSNEIVGVSYIDQPDGKFYPMDKIQKDEMFIPWIRLIDQLFDLKIEMILLND
jgi:hypothetical protein